MLTLSEDAPIIMAGVTIFAVFSWLFTPEEAWLSKKHISHFLEAGKREGEEVVGGSGSSDVAS